MCKMAIVLVEQRPNFLLALTISPSILQPHFQLPIRYSYKPRGHERQPDGNREPRRPMVINIPIPPLKPHPTTQCHKLCKLQDDLPRYGPIVAVKVYAHAPTANNEVTPFGQCGPRASRAQVVYDVTVELGVPDGGWEGMGEGLENFEELIPAAAELVVLDDNAFCKGMGVLKRMGGSQGQRGVARWCGRYCMLVG